MIYEKIFKMAEHRDCSVLNAIEKIFGSDREDTEGARSLLHTSEGDIYYTRRDDGEEEVYIKDAC